MIQAQVPKDIRAYEAKAVSTFTLRQLVSICVSAIIGYVLHKAILSPLGVSNEIAVWIYLIVSLPILAFGFVKPYGFPLEQYIFTYIQYNILAPNKRKARHVIMKRPALKKDSKEYKEAQKKYKKYIKHNNDLKKYI